MEPEIRHERKEAYVLRTIARLFPGVTSCHVQGFLTSVIIITELFFFIMRRQISTPNLLPHTNL